MDTSFLSHFTSPDATFNLVDLAILAFLFFGGIRGLFRGFSAEMAGLIGTTLVFFGGWKFYIPVSAFITEHTRVEDPFVSELLAYVVMVIVFMGVWNLIIFSLKKALGLTFGTNLKRTGGLLLGTAKSTLVACIILMAVSLSDHRFLKEHMIENSWFGSTSQQWIPEKLNKRLPTLFPAKEPKSTDAETEKTSKEPDGSGDA